ncbi:MAG TPA: nuclear transport factor 2 family protein [Candidatus Dormibacteraeota bacterium]|nr:nuclear transport factor 2 family protein [Candidatus Dormibacteraeota bacterium]
MTELGGNLAIILGAWTEMLRSGDVESLAAILDEKVIWQGVQPEQICTNRDEVLDVLVRNRGRAPRLTKIEAAEFGDRVAVSVEGPDFEDDDEGPPSGPPSLVFTLQNGRIIRMESTATRDAAFNTAR